MVNNKKWEEQIKEHGWDGLGTLKSHFFTQICNIWETHLVGSLVVFIQITVARKRWLFRVLYFLKNNLVLKYLIFLERESSNTMSLLFKWKFIAIPWG